jgi:hypothetical protein
MNDKNSSAVMAMDQTKSFAGKEIAGIFVEMDSESKVITGPIVFIFKDKSHFTIESESLASSTSLLLVETMDGVLCRKGTSKRLLTSVLGSADISDSISAEQNHKNYRKIRNIPGIVFSSLDARCHSSGKPYGDLMVSFLRQGSLVFCKHRDNLVWQPFFTVIGDRCDVQYDVLTHEEQEELGFVLLHNHYLAGRFEDMTGQDFVDKS